MWLAVAGHQRDAALQMLDQRWLDGLDDAGRQAAQTVVDLEAEQTTCPACQTVFQPTEPRCPDCGLAFG
ncbi:MAG: hypothetical protein AAF628_14135 [Planctomycetota bacterium]